MWLAGTERWINERAKVGFHASYNFRENRKSVSGSGNSHPTGRIEIVTASGHRVSVEGYYDADALARLLKGLVS